MIMTDQYNIELAHFKKRKR